MNKQTKSNSKINSFLFSIVVLFAINRQTKQRPLIIQSSMKTQFLMNNMKVIDVYWSIDDTRSRWTFLAILLLILNRFVFGFSFIYYRWRLTKQIEYWRRSVTVSMECRWNHVWSWKLSFFVSQIKSHSYSCRWRFLRLRSKATNAGTHQWNAKIVYQKHSLNAVW